MGNVWKPWTNVQVYFWHLLTLARKVEMEIFFGHHQASEVTVSGRGNFSPFWLFLSAQWAKIGAHRHIFSHFSLISQARKVGLRHFKSLNSSINQVHHGKAGWHQCTMGNHQGYTSALWAIRGTPGHYGQAGVHQCTTGKQVSTSALWAIRIRKVLWTRNRCLGANWFGRKNCAKNFENEIQKVNILIKNKTIKFQMSFLGTWPTWPILKASPLSSLSLSW